MLNHTGGCAMNGNKVSADYICGNIRDSFVELMECLQRRGNRVYIATHGDDSLGRSFAGITASHALAPCYMDTAFGTGQ